jgi:hypothetical protein
VRAALAREVIPRNAAACVARARDDRGVAVAITGLGITEHAVAIASAPRAPVPSVGSAQQRDPPPAQSRTPRSIAFSSAGTLRR